MPEGIGVWPAVALFLLFSWIENSYVYSSMPNHIGVMAIAYTVITLGGMHLYGKRQWLRHGEAFSVVFSLLAKFAPQRSGSTTRRSATSAQRMPGTR